MSAQAARYNVALNGYRGLCALLVFGFHIGSAGVMPWPTGSGARDAVTYLWSSLTYGVEMFFMISGYVILGSLLRHATIGGFLKDRFIRIYSAWLPALLAVTAVCAVLQMKVFANTTPLQGAGIFLANLALLPPLVPLPRVHLVSWSLTYEWVFYLLAAAGIVLLRRRTARGPAIAAWIVLTGSFVCLFPRALFFLAGVLVFVHRDWFASRQRWLRAPLPSLLVFLIAWRYTGFDKAHLNDTMLDWLLDGRWIAALLAFAAALHMFASICTDASRQFAFLTSRAFQFLGTISYSFYLWHALVMSVAKRAIAPLIVPEYGAVAGLVVFSLASLLIALPVSWASWRLFEVGLARLVHKALQPARYSGASVSAA